MKACILALMRGFALAGTGLVLTRQPPPTVAACIDRGCGASGRQSRQHSPHLRSMPLTTTGRRDDAASVEGDRKAVQARYAGRL